VEPFRCVRTDRLEKGDWFVFLLPVERGRVVSSSDLLTAFRSRCA